MSDTDAVTAMSRVCKIFQRTVWDTKEQHTIWCDCGQVFKADTAADVQEAWHFHRDAERAGLGTAGVNP